MNNAFRSHTKRVDQGKGDSQPMSPASPTELVRLDPQPLVRPSTTQNASARQRTNRIQLRQSSQPDIQEASKSRNFYRTVVHSTSSGTYTGKYKNSETEIQSKVGSLRAADQAILNNLHLNRQKRLNGPRDAMNVLGKTQNVQFSLPIPPQTVSGALSKEMYINKMGFDPLEQIASIQSDGFDIVSSGGQSTPTSALTKYVHTLQQWSPKGR